MKSMSAYAWLVTVTVTVTLALMTSPVLTEEEIVPDTEVEQSNVVNGAEKPAVTTCVLGGDRHTVGETWHPYLEPFGYMNCTTCYCQPGGSVSCWRETCPELECEHAATPPGHCCPVCPDDLMASEIADDYDQSLIEDPNDSSIFDNVLPGVPQPRPNRDDVTKDTVTADDVTDVSNDVISHVTRRSCEHYGEVFEDGERFSSKRTNLNPRSDQCVQCVCLDGEIYCHLKTCFSHICTTTIPSTDDCCPICADCVTDDVIYKNGSTWHPVVETVGEVPCVTCSCMNGDFTCVRQQCPSDEELPCDNPTVKEGQCCKSCPQDASNAVSLSLPIRGEEDGRKNRFCIPPGTNALVHQWRSKTALILAFQFRMSTVIYSFSLNKGKVLAVSSQWLSRAKFARLISQLRGVTILGATTTKRVEKFRRRVRRKFNSCQPNCRAKTIRRLSRSLRLRHATGKC